MLSTMQISNAYYKSEFFFSFYTFISSSIILSITFDTCGNMLIGLQSSFNGSFFLKSGITSERFDSAGKLLSLIPKFKKGFVKYGS